jgi:hypothetical protein
MIAAILVLPVRNFVSVQARACVVLGIGQGWKNFSADFLAVLAGFATRMNPFRHGD